MKKILLLTFFPCLLHASTVYEGKFRPQMTMGIQHPLEENVQHVLHREFIGHYEPHNFAYSNFTKIISKVTAPSGRTTRYVDTTAYSHNEFEIINNNNATITCLITRSLCMENGEGCINAQDVYTIPKNKNYHDRGSRLYNTWKYQYKHIAHTLATIHFESCGSPNDIVFDKGEMKVEV